MSFALALFAASTGPVALPPRIELEDRSIRVGDLARAAGRESVILGAMPEGKTTVSIDRETAERLIANRLPGVAFTLRFTDAIELSAPAAKRLAGTCFRTRHDLAPGALILTEDVEATPCKDDPRANGLGWDRKRSAPVARGGLIAGSYLGPIRLAEEGSVARGTRLTFRTGDGPVLIERRVEALQNGRPGGRIFARTDDGEVIAAPLLSLEETEE